MSTLILPARRLTAADENWATALLTEAYAAAPGPSGALTDAGTRRAWLQLLVRHGLRAGCVYASPTDESVAVWLPAEAHALWWSGLLHTGPWGWPWQLGWRAFRHLLQGLQQQQALRRRAVAGPHHQLLALGVLPERQKRGAGRALLRASLAAVGARFQPCFMAVHSVRDLHFARQLGFEVAAVDDDGPGADARALSWGLVRPAGAV